MLDALWASVVATIVLIIINIVYAWQNRQVIKEMQETRRAEFIPNLKAKLSWPYPNFLTLQITNFGKGPAMNIKAEVIFQPSEEKRPWEASIMSPGESIRILLPEGRIDKVLEKSSKIILKGEYKDIFNRTFKMDEIIDVKVFIEQAQQLSQLWESDIVREVSDIKGEMRKIRDNLERLTKLERKGKTTHLYKPKEINDASL